MEPKKSRRYLLLGTLVAGVALVAFVMGAMASGARTPSGVVAVPGVVSYQGYLEGEDGSPISGTVDLMFGLYGSAQGGTQLWGETQTSVAVNNGYFAVLLGSVTPLSAADFSGATRYLQVSVDQGSGFVALPRQPIASVPFAFQAEAAASSPWGGLTGVPAGFADGVDDDTQYSAGDGLVLSGTVFGAESPAWNDLIGVPAGFADGVDNDTQYSAGEGLALNGTVFSVVEGGYAGVVVVAKSGGNFTSVQAAIDSLTDASADNPYLVWVAPGVYMETVAMKPYVHLQGAGQGATVITSTASSELLPPDAATVILSSNTSLRDLTVGNSGAGGYNAALLAPSGTSQTRAADVTAVSKGTGSRHYGIFLEGSGTGVVLERVSSLGEGGGTSNYGLYLLSGAAATLHGGDYTGSGGSGAYGVFSTGSGTSLEATSISALGENGSSVNYGLFNGSSAEAVLHGGSYTGRGGSNAYGVSSVDSGTTLEATSIAALGENASAGNYGLRNGSSAIATLYGGDYTGLGGSSAYGAYNSGATLEATSISALGANGSNNYGLYQTSSASASLHGGDYTGRAGSNTYGVYSDSSALEATSISALGQVGSSVNYGLYNQSGSTAEVTQSSLEGATNTVSNPSGTVTISNGRLVGGVVNGTVTCVLVSRGTNVTTSGGTCP